MKKVKDKFSDRSEFYKKFRPTYPQNLYDEILKVTSGRIACWDCGTGNGQVAVQLSNYFKTVYATDISENQISRAEKRNNIVYKIERSEKTSFRESHFDLITVAQAIHWFDLNAFYKEAKRVIINGGIICIWGYGLPRVDKTINELLDHFYWDVIGSYWNSERKHVDNEYKSIRFDFDEINIKKQFEIITKWTITEFEGYLNSWSSVHNYMFKNNINPVNLIMDKVLHKWDKDSKKEFRFPIFLKLGKVKK